MAEFPALPLWTDAYLADCSHLGDAEHGRYLLILMHLWRMPDIRFPNDDAWLARKFGRSVEVIELEWKPLMREFLKCDGNWWRSTRLVSEWEYLKKMSYQRRGAAKARWAKEKDTCERNAGPHEFRNAPTPTPTPTPSKKENILSAAAQPDSLDFEKFWLAYPREKNMSKKRALMAWEKLTPEKRVQATAAVPGYRSYCEKNKSWYHTVHAERFLSHERFEGFAAEHQPSSEEIELAKDRADRLLRRGKYAVDYT